MNTFLICLTTPIFLGTLGLIHWLWKKWGEPWVEKLMRVQ